MPQYGVKLERSTTEPAYPPPFTPPKGVEEQRRSLSGQFDKLVDANLDLLSAVRTQVKAIYILLFVTCAALLIVGYSVHIELKGMHEDVLQVLKIVSQPK